MQCYWCLRMLPSFRPFAPANCNPKIPEQSAVLNLEEWVLEMHQCNPNAQNPAVHKKKKKIQHIQQWTRTWSFYTSDAAIKMHKRLQSNHCIVRKGNIKGGRIHWIIQSQKTFQEWKSYLSLSGFWGTGFPDGFLFKLRAWKVKQTVTKRNAHTYWWKKREHHATSSKTISLYSYDQQKHYWENTLKKGYSSL